MDLQNYVLLNLNQFYNHQKKIQREARLFISFRPADKIKDEVSITSGYQYNTAKFNY